MAFKYLGFIFHIQYFHTLIDQNNSGALQLLKRRLFMTHDTTSILSLCKVHKFLK